MSATVGYYRPGTSWLHRRNPVTRLLGLAWVVLAAFMLAPAAVALPALIMLMLVVAATAGLLRPVIRALRIPALLLASIVVVNALVYPGATGVLVAAGPVVVTTEGIAFGLLTAGRLLVAFLASILFLQTTLPDDLLEALVARGVSHRISFVILSAVQMVPRLRDRASTVLEAQQSRGLDVTGGIRRRARAVIPLIGPVVLGSLIDVRERALALEARGFGSGPRRTAYRVVADPPLDRWLRLALLIGILLLVAWPMVVPAAGLR